MNQTINRRVLFLGSCFALITTALSFAIRAGILPELGREFGLSARELGFINSMWFFGAPISMLLGGIFYYKIGPKNIMRIAFISHTLGILLTIFTIDRKSTRLNSSHVAISYAVFCLKK